MGRWGNIFFDIVFHIDLIFSLREMCEAQEEVMRLLEENGTIIKRFQRITSQSDLSEDH